MSSDANALALPLEYSEEYGQIYDASGKPLGWLLDMHSDAMEGDIGRAVANAANSLPALEAENAKLRAALENALEDSYQIEPHIPHTTERVMSEMAASIKAALKGERNE